jgi:phage terminase small subunit
MSAKKKLTDKQRVFVAEYGKDRNATQAAIRAGYSKKTARSVGAENLTKPDVREAIDKSLEKSLKNAGLTADMVNEVLAGMILTNNCDLYTEGPDGTMIPKSVDELTPRQRMSVQESTLMTGADGSGYQRIKQYDKLKAIDIYNKKTGVYQDSNTTNNIANLHVTVLEMNRALKRVGEPEIIE